MLKNYLDFQVNVIERRTKFLLAKDEARVHIVIGLIKCHDNIDEIVDLIKASATPEEATNKLMERFGFSDPQVQAILGMNLRRLTGIETEKLEAEKAQLDKNIAEYNRILSSRENETEVVINELLEIKEKFGGLRWYDNVSTKKVSEIINKYEYISMKTCIVCGEPATYISNGWISPYCDKHIDNKDYATPIEKFYNIDADDDSTVLD